MMNDLEEMEKEDKENSQMNWFVAVVLVVGSPLIVEVFMNRPWAEVALKIYSCTAVVFGSLLLFLERKSLKERWLWTGIVPLLVVHAAFMYGLARFNMAFPRMDRFPVATYGALVPLCAVEGGILYVILERFRPKTDI